jgi:hypothetical protein
LLGSVYILDVLRIEVIDPSLKKLLERFHGDAFSRVGVEFVFYDVVAKTNTLVTDIDPRTCNHLLDVLVVLPAERTLDQVADLTDALHASALSSSHHMVPS